MTAYDQHVNRKILEFAKVWAPYGGAHHEDIFVAYGLTPRQYYQRLADLLPTVPSADLTPTQARLIHTQCLNHINAQKSQPESHEPLRPAPNADRPIQSANSTPKRPT